MTSRRTIACCLVTLGSVLHGGVVRADLACEPTALFESERSSAVADLQEDGRIVGYESEGHQWFVPFMWASGRPTEMGLLESSVNGFPTAFNARGEAVGASEVDGEMVPTFWRNGTATALSLGIVDPSAASERVVVRDINAQGQIVGDNRTRGTCLLWPDGSSPPTSITPDDATQCRSLGINDRGDVLLVVPTAYLVRHADGTITRITDVPVPVPLEQFGIINNTGTVVGSYGAADRSFVFRAHAGKNQLTIHDGIPLALNDQDDLALVRVGNPVPVILGSEHPIDLIDRNGTRRTLGALPNLPLFRYERVIDGLRELDPRVYLNARRQLAWTTQEVRMTGGGSGHPKLFPLPTLVFTGFTCQL